MASAQRVLGSAVVSEVEIQCQDLEIIHSLALGDASGNISHLHFTGQALLCCSLGNLGASPSGPLTLNILCCDSHRVKANSHGVRATSGLGHIGPRGAHGKETPPLSET